MTKIMTNFSVTKNGMPLDPALYAWDEKAMTDSENFLRRKEGKDV